MKDTSQYVNLHNYLFQIPIQYFTQIRNLKRSILPETMNEPNKVIYKILLWYQTNLKCSNNRYA